MVISSSLLAVHVQVSGPVSDLHAGVDGGVGNEPLMDLMGVLAALLDVRGMISIARVFTFSL
jgi:hypothetical protein